MGIPYQMRTDMGAKSRPKGYFNVQACIGKQCAVRDVRCKFCVMIQGKPSEYVPIPPGAFEK
jgi:hypothetical protein